MPKPVKNATKKSTTPKRASSDPNLRTKQMMSELAEKAATGQPPWAKDFTPAVITVTDTITKTRATPSQARAFEAQYRAHMSKLGAKGGKISGAKRMEMPKAQRTAIAKKAAAARWKAKS